MKMTLLTICLTLLVIGCKKDETQPSLSSRGSMAQSDTIQSCPNSTYYLKFHGPNCDESVLDQFVGNWQIYDSVILMNYKNGSSPSYIRIIGFQTASITKEIVNGTPVYKITNLWGENESCTLFNNKDNINAYSSLLPNYKGNVVRAIGEGQTDVPFTMQPDGSLLFKRKVDIYLGNGFGNSNYFYIKLKRQ